MLYNTNEKLLNYLKKRPLVLAPMAGVTDYPFRSFMKEMNAGIMTTELVSAVALVREEPSRTKKIAFFTPDQQPIGVQIFGEDPQTLASAAVKVEEMGASFVDLNLGCPVPKIVKKGAGSAILKDLKLLSKILKTIRSRISIPLTIKVRTGWDIEHRNSLTASKIAFEEGCLWMTIHGRTRKQGYSGTADWDYIMEVKSKAKLPIIGNGDLIHPRQIQSIYFKTKCDGLMIGRGCLKNPMIFNQAYQAMRKCKNLQEEGESFSSLPPLDLLKSLFHHLSLFYDEKMALIQFKKFSVWFSAGRPESALFRKNIFQIKNKEDILKYAFDYFNHRGFSKKETQNNEPFLMQGHG